MSKLKKWIIVLMFLIIMIAILLVYLIFQNRGTIVYEIDEVGDEIVSEDKIDKTFKKVDNRVEYYSVKDCVNKFYVFYTSIYEAEDNEEKKGSIEKLYNMLDPNYIRYYNLNIENLETHINKINDCIINITDMYVSQRTQNISIYVVKGTIREIVTGKITNFTMMVNLDKLNKTFTVLLQDYIDKNFDEIEIGSNIDIQITEEIKKNDINIYESKYISDEIYVSDIFKKYKEEILYNPKLAFKHLDEEYSEKRFENFEDFQNYLKNNIVKNVISKIDRFNKTSGNNYTTYICVDQNDRYYIFKEKSVMDYSMILDTYTIDIPEFIETYNKAKDQEKIGLNIQKVFSAINDKDYKYAYSKLDGTFKNNNFKTLANFENYIKSQLFKENKVTYKSYEQTGKIGVYTLEITDKEGKDTKIKNMQVIMALGEGTEFVMSFSIN